MQTGSSTDCYINNFAHPVVVVVRVVTFIKCIRIPASSWSAFITHSSAIVIVFGAIVVISTHPSSSASPHSPSMPSLRSYFGPCCCIRVIQFLPRFAASGIACSGCCSSLRQVTAVAAGPWTVQAPAMNPHALIRHLLHLLRKTAPTAMASLIPKLQSPNPNMQHMLSPNMHPFLKGSRLIDSMFAICRNTCQHIS